MYTEAAFLAPHFISGTIKYLQGLGKVGMMKEAILKASNYGEC